MLNKFSVIELLKKVLPYQIKQTGKQVLWGMEKVREQIISEAPFRKSVFKQIPDNSCKILDFGCGTGSLLLRLQQQKNCTQLYGADLEPSLTFHLRKFIDGVFNVNLEDKNSYLFFLLTNSSLSAKNQWNTRKPRKRLFINTPILKESEKKFLIPTIFFTLPNLL